MDLFGHSRTDGKPVPPSAGLNAALVGGTPGEDFWVPFGSFGGNDLGIQRELTFVDIRRASRVEEQG